MPFIDTKNKTYEEFNRLIEEYRHAIENDPAAQCMIGFTAASILRDDSTDLSYFKDWLLSLKPALPQEPISTNAINQILYAFNNCNEQIDLMIQDDTEYDSDATTIESEEEEDEGLELKRFTSINPFFDAKPEKSTYLYQPTFTFV